ncbi:hypothetical protein ACJX0J_007044, partial [Zea mays]
WSINLWHMHFLYQILFWEAKHVISLTFGNKMDIFLIIFILMHTPYFWIIFGLGPFYNPVLQIFDKKKFNVTEIGMGPLFQNLNLGCNDKLIPFLHHPILSFYNIREERSNYSYIIVVSTLSSTL